MSGQLFDTVINTVKMNHIKKGSRLTGLCILGWVLGMYSLTIFVAVKQDLLDAGLAILKKENCQLKNIFVTLMYVIICIATYLYMRCKIAMHYDIYICNA